MIDTPPQPSVLDLLRVLSTYDPEIYVIGGAVRDLILGVPPKDVDVGWDLSEYGYEHDVLTEMGGLAMRLEDQGFKVVPNDYLVMIVSANNGDVEIAVARKEMYRKGTKQANYKPRVKHAAKKQDILRRDFTINTMSMKIRDYIKFTTGAGIFASVEEFIDDPCGGIADLLSFTLRSAQEPVKSFTDDPTRMIRAVKFSVRYNLAVEGAVTLAAQKVGSELFNIPYEAWVFTLVDALKLHPQQGANLLQDFGLLQKISNYLVFKKPVLAAVVTHIKKTCTPWEAINIALELNIASSASITSFLTGHQIRTLAYSKQVFKSVIERAGGDPGDWDGLRKLKHVDVPVVELANELGLAADRRSQIREAATAAVINGGSRPGSEHWKRDVLAWHKYMFT